MSRGNFDLVRRVNLDYADLVVSKWQSRRTGLSVVHLDCDAPIVNGYFVIATEIFDDSGCPHTLEHLVFMGSEKYPHKGVLDLLANRGFSNGTNAWTDTDHTAYTISTAGEQGFLQLLPIYVDHILYPTITNAAYVTEVHHVNGQGQDSGVVYSEMQGRENTSGDIMALRMQQLLDPPGSAYRSETGGLMEALRRLTAEQIRQYHATYYVPHNMTLIVTGKLPSGTESLLDVVQDRVEPQIIAHGQDKGSRPPGWKRPFLETPSANRIPVSKPIKETVEFPEQDESVGELAISFLGPAPAEFLERRALDILGTYLTSSATAPLTKEYVETESPLCTYVYFDEDLRATRVNLTIYVGSVPVEFLDDFENKLKASLKRIVDDGIDMSRMQMVINRDERQLRSRVESGKGDTFSGVIISDFLYGAPDGSDLPAAMDDINQFAQLRTWDNKQWAKLLQKYYIDQPAVTVVGKPSAELAGRLEKNEKDRIAKQIENLGPEGLKNAAALLDSSKAEHDKPIPKEVLTSFPVPDVKSISWIPVQSVQEPGVGRKPFNAVAQFPELRRVIENDGSPLPFFVEYDSVKSDFITVHAYFSFANLPDNLRPYLSTYLSSFFSLPVVRQTGEKLSHEQVVNQLDDETVSYDAAFGVAETFTENFRVSIKVELSSYEKAIAWLRDLVYGSVFDRERLQVTAAKIQQTLPELKRDGNNVLGSLWMSVVYGDKNTSRANSVLSQMEFIPTLAQELQSNPDKVIHTFEQIRKHITDPSGIRFSVTGDVLRIKAPRSTWAKHFNNLQPAPLAPVALTRDTLSQLGNKPVKKAVVMKLPTIESSYVMHSTKVIAGFGREEYPAIRVAMEVLNATEGYLWHYIRGSGLAYGAYISLDVEAGLLTFTLYRSSNSMAGFEEAAKVVKGLVDGTIELDQTVIDSAKSSMVYGVTKGVSTPGRAAMTSFTNQALKGVTKNYGVELLDKFQAITKEDIVKTLRQSFLPLFDPSSSVAIVVTAPSKAEEIGTGLQSLGFDVTHRELAVDPTDMEGVESGSDSESSDDSSR
ncbi:hypothetical protein AGABI1DRAFT_124130 [Agaricus bisporus var. burnettii JB137-S8]|uniref:Mitochondrial presequence protease n=1 Tax=Agaricus bisporus var. burnettii (strain JB137-S8 / ATCC MYA-4627 / FGSC 10392) TaxID=597362 RepID=K5X7C5_AGABU|nr:uncharacterized protein AGABI1DRAFT_124130 [Agaricus bisporus var. burnettii JB137-S8]EKM83806.1 hypothetical protein AGABI1DRAFT_124130 [Agaricus bisporus var. burnettii JB137-S8]